VVYSRKNGGDYGQSRRLVGVDALGYNKKFT
jgi:hypothetical protein